MAQKITLNNGDIVEINNTLYVVFTTHKSQVILKPTHKEYRDDICITVQGVRVYKEDKKISKMLKKIER